MNPWDDSNVTVKANPTIMRKGLPSLIPVIGDLLLHIQEYPPSLLPYYRILCGGQDVNQGTGHPKMVILQNTTRAIAIARKKKKKNCGAKNVGRTAERAFQS